MSRMTRSSAPDPTIKDVLVAVQEGFVSVERRMDTLEGRMDGFEQRMDKNEALTKTLVVQVENMGEQMGDMHRRVVNLEHGVADIVETLDDMGIERTRDRTVLNNHERRLRRLEKAKA
jgi:predicted  nucleic acid-binding Zn-ribbon protein